MKATIRHIVWRFCETTPEYPELADRQKLYVRSPADVVQNFRFLFHQIVHERFVCLWLNTANRVMGLTVVSEGTLNSSLVHPREVFRDAIVATSASIIVMHNHPSGNPEPSQEDITITRQLVESGKVLGIPVHDHVIIAEDGYTSFAERGLL
ncbi:MAG: DNA repair protein RadC [Bacteroidota bacterium]|jgi:DNA repair protein RadC